MGHLVSPSRLVDPIARESLAMAAAEDSKPRSRMVMILLAGMAYAVLCGWPYYRWLAHPSLFGDDFLRVGSLRRSTLGEALFRPFNEHMAPLFETVSWLAWQGAGRRVMAVPMAFMAASFVAFGLTAGLLGVLIRRELRSTTIALVGVAVFCLSAVSAETVLWFSASSFQWAAWATLAGWLCSAMACESPSSRRRAGWLAGSMVSAMGAPAFSAIGLLAGPMASVRTLASINPPVSLARRVAWSIVPLLGTGLYLIVCEQFHYRDLLSSSVRRNFSPGAALWAAGRAPMGVLVPSLVGLPAVVQVLPGTLLAAAGALGLLVALGWAWRSRDRPLILGGLALIAGGYLSAFATRAHPGDFWIFEVRRYHLFPEIGLVWLVAVASAPRLRRFDRNLGSSLFIAAGVAAALAIPQYPRMQAASEPAFRCPEQSRALASTVRLEALCEREGITLLQAMRVLEPIQAPWFPIPWPFNPLLNLFSDGPTVARLPDSLARQRLIESLSIEDREALFGGMEATRYRLPARSWSGTRPAIEARVVAGPGVSPTGRGSYRIEGWPALVEFEVGPEADRARALCLPGLGASRPLEIWWADVEGDWSTYRRVRWTPDPDRSAEDWGVPLDLLPHWNRGHVRRLRLILREAGPVELESPRFLP
jgi:hypothetical protein